MRAGERTASICAAAGLLSLVLAVGAGAEDGVVASSDGEENQTTEAFTVSGPWTIDWQTGAHRFEISVIGYASGIPNIVVSRPGDGQGQAMMVRSGTFRLQVVADGPWQIDILGESGGST